MYYKAKSSKIVEEKVIHIKSRISQAINELSSAKIRPTPSSLGIIKYLREIEEYLSQNKLDRKDLEWFSFGIYRLVTDVGTLEMSPIGQELLKISIEIRDLSVTVVQSDAI